MLSRAERSYFTEWWWTVDRWFIAAAGTLMVLGVLLALVGSPPVAERLKLPTFHFVNKQILYLIPAIVLMVGGSLLSPRHVRRAAFLLFVAGMAGVVAALLFGAEIKGARRWIFGLQPSEFVKPAFVVLAAWAFSEGARRKDVPANAIALLLLPVTIVPLLLQPDFGQTMLIAILWAGLFFMAGLHWFWVAGIGGIGVLGVFIAYNTLSHVRERVDGFLDPSDGPAGNSFQVDTAIESFVAGGWFGKGPGGDTFKRHLPDSHTDFIFAATGEEFGILVCIGIAALFAFVVLRGLMVASRNADPFCRFATAGLVMLFGLQSAINMAVNLRLMPAKGMTLPFISYGGSSLWAMAIAMGFLIAVTRRRPRSEVVDRIEG